MTMTNGLRAHVRENADVEELRQQSYRDGMKPLRINGALKVAAGTTTVEEVLSITPSLPTELQQSPKLATG